MIDAQGWFDWAEQVMGNTLKTNPGTNSVLAFTAHSAEGYEAYLRANPPLDATTGGAKSWHLTTLKDGTLLQNYSLFARCWHAGEAEPNQSWVSHELEGVAGEPMTEAQLATVIRVIREIAEWRGWTPKRDQPDRTLWEHRDVHQTACPSGRYPWDTIMAALQEDDMAVDNYPGEIDEHRAQVVLIEAIMTGKLRVAFGGNGLLLTGIATDGSIATYDVLVPIPDWGKPSA